MASALDRNERPKVRKDFHPAFCSWELDVRFVDMQRNAMTRGETYAT